MIGINTNRKKEIMENRIIKEVMVINKRPHGNQKAHVENQVEGVVT